MGTGSRDVSSHSKRGGSWQIPLLACGFVVAGILHFVIPRRYEAIIPFWVPEHPLMVQLSGAAELMGGIGLLFPLSRPAAGWGLIALLVAVFPANVEMLRQAYAAAESSSVWRVALWMRLPLQGVLIWWIGKVAGRNARPTVPSTIDQARNAPD